MAIALDTTVGFQSEARERIAQNMARWRRRSRQIKRWRRLLPALIVAIVLLLAGWVVAVSILSSMAQRETEGPAASIRMVNARFFSRDDKGSGYELAAAEAARDNNDLQRVTLNQPRLVIDRNTPDQATVDAAAGVYREDTRVVRLNQNVQYRNSRGYKFDTPAAVVDAAKGVISGDAGIAGNGPLGSIRAQNFWIYDRGARVVLKGSVAGVIDRPYREPQAPGAPPPAPPPPVDPTVFNTAQLP